MKGFLKHIVFFFFGLIIFVALFDIGSSDKADETEVQDKVIDLEEAVANGETVEDGIMTDEDEAVTVPSVIGESTSIIGNSVIGAVSSFLELIGEAVYNFFAQLVWLE